MNKRVVLSICVLLLFGIVFLTYSIKTKYNDFKEEYNENLDNRMIRVYYANGDILSGDVIYADMINSKEIKASDNDDYILDVDDLVGKCVKDNVNVYDGDIFKKDFVDDCA